LTAPIVSQDWEALAMTSARRRLAFAASLVALLLCDRGVASARFVLYLHGEPAAAVENRAKRFTDADGLLTGYSSAAGGVHLYFAAHGFTQWFNLDFVAPAGTSLVRGEYSGATRAAFAEPGTPGLEVSGNGVGCNTLTGHFTVHDVVFAPGDVVRALSVDFEQHCDGEAAALRGSVRLNVGHPGCGSVMDGVPCDDGDACTTGDACAIGSCLGAFVAPASCAPPAEACFAQSACAPASGSCPVVPVNGLACDDGSVCTIGDTCEAVGTTSLES
jgi:hypothetical protein